MKLIRLAGSRVIQYFAENKLIFILYLFGSITCVITFLYFYGNTLSTKKMEVRDFQEYRQYTAKLDVPLTVTSNQLAFLDGYRIDDLKQSGEVSIDDKLAAELAAQYPGKNKQSRHSLTLTTYFFRRSPIFSQRGRTDFTEDELYTGKAVIIMPSGYTGDLNSMVQIEKTSCRVIGISTFEQGIIPDKLYQKLGVQTKQLVIILNGKLSANDSDALADRLHQAFPKAQIESPANYRENAEKSVPGELMMVSVIYLVALASFVFILKYMSDRNSTENVIYAIVGASKKKIMTIMVLENIILSACSGIIGILLHVFLYNPFFSKINTLENISYNWVDYLLVFLFTVLLSLLTTLPFLISFWRASLIESKNKYGAL